MKHPLQKIIIISAADISSELQSTILHNQITADELDKACQKLSG
ncbi:hypothetical protein [Streptococcus devriesei]|nr:hypothetical protein [Streptococcus devriesei]